jgi:hypothetical protein
MHPRLVLEAHGQFNVHKELLSASGDSSSFVDQTMRPFIPCIRSTSDVVVGSRDEVVSVVTLDVADG